MATQSEPRHKSIAELQDLAAKCPRCSLCKFPPLVTVKSKQRSSICPSYDEYQFHSHSGSGRVIVANSLFEGRIDVTDATRDVVFQCTLCGGCDMACKFSSDIEINEIMLALRAESFERRGPLPAHERMLQNLRMHGHALEDDLGKKGDWLFEVPNARTGYSPRVLLVGASYALLPERRTTLLNLARLLSEAGVEYSALGDAEPDTGTLALQLGDLTLFDTLANGLIEAFNRAGVEEVICADPEDLATLRGHYGKVGTLKARVRHAVEVLDEAIAEKRLQPRRRVQRRVTYHDPCSLGRRSEEYQAWDGDVRKIMGQLLVYDPPRPVNRGANGVYDPPRRILAAIPGLELVEMPRKREYAYCCGGGGGVAAAYPEFASNTANERLDEAGDVGADLVVSACPGCEGNLDRAAVDRGVEVAGIYDVLAESVFGTRA